MSTRIERLRNEHRHCSCWGENCSVKCKPQEDWNSHCFKCAVTWPCDTIAALDALEKGLHQLLDARPSRGQLMARLDVATELIRQAMEERHYSIRPNTGDSETRCGSPIGTSIDTCENCRPYREWLGKEEHSE